MDNQTKTIGQKWGLILGGVLAAITIIVYSIDVSLLVNFSFSLLLIAIVLAIGFMAAKEYKAVNGGFGSFSDILKTLIITFAIGVLISFIVKFILFNFIDTNVMQQMIDLSGEKSQELAETMGVEMTEEAVDKIRETNPFSASKMFLSYIIVTAGNIIFGLIIAAITKNKKPEFE